MKINFNWETWKYKIFLIIFILGFLFYFLTRRTPIDCFIKEVPIQKNTKNKPFKHKGVIITPFATYKITARVIHSSFYWFDTPARTGLSNIDLGLGWREMSDLNNLHKIKFSQSNRWLYWRTSELLFPKKVYEENISNNHIIHANYKILRTIWQFQKGDLVELEGYLVDVNSDNINWSTSRTRQDIGNQSCEIFYVEQARRLTHYPE